MILMFLDRCDLQGQLGSPGCPNGHGPSGPRPLEQDHELQPKEPKVDQPRQIRAFVSIPCFLYSSFDMYLPMLGRHCGYRSAHQSGACSSQPYGKEIASLQHWLLCNDDHIERLQFFWSRYLYLILKAGVHRKISGEVL